MKVKRSLQTKLLLIVLLPMAVISIATITVFGSWRVPELTNEHNQLQSGAVRLYADMIAASVWQMDHDALKTIVTSIYRQTNVEWIEVIDETGNTLASGGKKNSQKEFDYTRHIIDVLYPDRHGHFVKVGELHIAFSNERIRSYVFTDMFRISILSLFIIIVQIFCIVLAFRNLIKIPLISLVDTIYKSERTNRNEQVQVSTNDEFGFVINAYNYMQARLDAHAKRLEALYNKTPGLLFTIDPDGKIMSVSDFFCEALAIERSYLIGSPINSLIDESSCEEFQREYLPALHFGKELNSVEIVLRPGLSHEKMYCLINSIPEFDVECNLQGNFCIMTDISKQIKNQEIVAHQANYDLLTDLPNRHLLLSRLNEGIRTSQRHSRYLAVLFFDLDHFKWVNDSYGHTVGDKLLLGVAERLKDSLRESETAARFGGDEFVVILSDLKHTEDVMPPLQRILKELSKPYDLGDKKIFSTVSVGIAVYPTDAESPEALLMHADSAMFKAKDTSQNSYHFFSPDLDKLAKDRIELAFQIASAVTEQRLRLYFQPIVEMKTGVIVGYEALMRMISPLNGQIVSPDAFIPLAEELGFIKDMGIWAIEQVVSILAAWEQKSPTTMPEYISVNVSPKQLQDEKFPGSISKLLRQYEIDPRRLVLELTESCLITASSRNKTMIDQLAALGCPLSIDDFGTGYSSLSSLKNFPFSILKIDREFIRNLDKEGQDYDLVQAIIAITGIFGLKVVIEGVETEVQVDLLKNLAKERDDIYAQGYLFGKPMPLEMSNKQDHLDT